VDETSPANHWHVDTYGVVAPLSGKAAWCGDLAMASCGVGDLAGGYNNSWNDILEFRKTVGAAATVRVQADLVYDSEPGYDFTTLQRRTAANPFFEPITGGQGLSWDGIGTEAVDYTFTYTGPNCMKAPTSLSRSSSTRLMARGPTATACGRPTAPPAWTTSR
jgi:hypothetical protein